jgi:hypothetical protein
MSQPPDVADLLSDVLLVRRELLHETPQLSRDRPACNPKHSERQNHHQEHGHDAAESSLERYHRRTEDECEEQRDCDRDDDDLSPVQHCDDQDASREREPSPGV